MAAVLLIEDDTDIVFLYRASLTAAGHHVCGVHDHPSEALESATDPDVIVLDERLRGRSGTRYLPELRERFPNARILLATADTDRVRKAAELGADRAALKPFPLAAFVAMVDELTGNE